LTYIARPRKVHGVVLLNTLFVALAKNVYRVHVLVQDVIRILVSLRVVEILVKLVVRAILLLFVKAGLHALAVVLKALKMLRQVKFALVNKKKKQ